MGAILVLAELLPVAFFVVFAGIIALPIWLIVRTRRRNRAHRDETRSGQLARIAGEQGWTYTAEATGYLEHYTSYPFDSAGPDTPVADLVTGTHRARSFAAFQWVPPRSLPAGEPAPLEINYFRAFMVTLPASVPTITITPGDSPRWTRRFTTGDDAFDKALAVGCDDEPFALRLLTEPVRLWLRDNPPRVGSDKWTLRLDDGYLIAWYKEDDLFDPRLVEPALDYLCDLLDQIPAAAWSNAPDAP